MTGNLASFGKTKVTKNSGLSHLLGVNDKFYMFFIQYFLSLRGFTVFVGSLSFSIYLVE